MSNELFCGISTNSQKMVYFFRSATDGLYYLQLFQSSSESSFDYSSQSKITIGEIESCTLSESGNIVSTINNGKVKIYHF